MFIKTCKPAVLSPLRCDETSAAEKCRFVKVCLIINWEISAQRLVISERNDRDVETELQMCRWTHCAHDGWKQLNAPASSLHLPFTSRSSLCKHYWICECTVKRTRAKKVNFSFPLLSSPRLKISFTCAHLPFSKCSYRGFLITTWLQCKYVVPSLGRELHYPLPLPRQWVRNCLALVPMSLVLTVSKSGH